MSALGFFPTPYPDELFYSLWCRYFNWLGIESGTRKRKIINNIFRCKIYYDLPKNIKGFNEKLSEKTLLTPKYIIQNHTLFPLFEPFIPKQKKAEVLCAMLNKTSKSAQGILGMTNLVAVHPWALRFCENCVEEAEQNFGESYWHRAHQAIGVYLCHKHNSPLREGVDYIHGEFQDFFLPDKNQASRSYPLVKKDLMKHKMIADGVYELLSNSYNKESLDVLYKKYYLLYEYSYQRSPKSKSNLMFDFMDVIEDFYGDDFMNFMRGLFSLPFSFKDLVYDPKSSRNALVRMTTPPPLWHIVLIKFFGLTIREFLEEDFSWIETELSRDDVAA